MMYLMLAEAGADAAPFASLRRIAYGGSPITEALLRQAMSVFGCELVQLYGLTESGNAAVCLPAGDHAIGSPLLRAAGRPLPGVQVEIVDEQGRPVECGRIGEVCLRTPAAMQGYWKLPEATAAALHDGWLRTGDAGRLDADGYLHICDRLKDMVIVAGENIYPAEVENALCEHPSVAEAAVVGLPDARWGESVLAHVVPRDGQVLTPRALTLFLRERLADFKIPTRYRFVDTLPRNASGKILRRALREQQAADLPEAR
jgi:long-chain acyl-CoA synthetase